MMSNGISGRTWINEGDSMHPWSGMSWCTMLGVLAAAWWPGTAAGQPELPRPMTPAFDPGVIFDSWDRNRDGVVTREELPDLRAWFRFQDFVRRAGVTDGRLTREAFLQAFQDRMAELTRRSVTDAQRLLRLLDRNGDNRLGPEELPQGQRLRNEFDLWDNNRDGHLAVAELQEALEFYARERLLGPLPGPATPSDRPPAASATAGASNPAPAGADAKAPSSTSKAVLPDWFSTLDADRDGQIALHEWQGMPLEQFHAIDRNGDGLLTADEVLRWQAAQVRR